jgi:hypothetical protein
VPHHIPDPELLLEQLEEGLAALGAAAPVAAAPVVRHLEDPPEPLRRLFRRQRVADSGQQTASVCEHTLAEGTAETGGGGDSSLGGGDGGVSSQQVAGGRGGRGAGGGRGGGRGAAGGGGGARGNKWRSVLGVK